ncbi:uncharacterized protein V1510DRAFT_416476 [Dipodascopsis tothii]|uniref:uncharacterized protein n=1 Tax=Dipodascopsis tothii TaxID=44089 RepID=UPI0034CFBCBA
MDSQQNNQTPASRSSWSTRSSFLTASSSGSPAPSLRRNPFDTASIGRESAGQASPGGQPSSGQPAPPRQPPSPTPSVRPPNPPGHFDSSLAPPASPRYRGGSRPQSFSAMSGLSSLSGLSAGPGVGASAPSAGTGAYRPPPRGGTPATLSALRASDTTELPRPPRPNMSSAPSFSSAGGERSDAPRVPVDSHDGLWIIGQELMEDVDRVSRQVTRESGGDIGDAVSEAKQGHFFGRAHVTALEDLRQRQLELATDMARGEGVLDFVAQQGKLWELSDNEISITKAPGGKAAKGEPSQHAVDNARNQESSGRLFNEEHFRKVQECVDSVMTQLDSVVQSMKVLEAESRELWNENEM